MTWQKLLISGFATFVCSIVYLLCYEKVSNIKIKKDAKVLIKTMILSFLIVFSNCYITPGFNIIINFLLMFLLYQTLFKLKFLKTFFYSFVIWIMGMILDLASAYLLIFLNIKDLQQLLNTALWLKLVISLSIPVAMYCLFSLKFYIKLINNMLEKTSVKELNYELLAILLILGATALSLINSFIYENTIIKYLIALVLIVFCIMLFLIILLYYKKNEIKLENLRLSENNDNYSIISKEYRLLRHNLINRLLGINALANKKAKALIEDLITQYQKENQFIDIIDSIPYGINGIIYQKIYPYANDDIEIFINSNVIEKTFQKLSARKYNLLCETIGIVLDNALEALKDCSNKILYIHIEESENKLIICVINTFKNDIDLEKLGNENYSTKNRKSGIGLNYLLNNKKLQLQTRVINNMFLVKFNI